MLTAIKSANAAMVALFLVVAIQARSQEPAPGPGKAGQPEQTHPDGAENHGATDQGKPKPPPIVVNVLAAPKSEPEAAEDRREREEKTKLDRRLVDLTDDLAIFTGGLFATTVVLTLATGALWWSTKKLVRGAEQTAKRQLRAYVHVADVTILEMNSELCPNIRIKFKNYGQTPAYKVSNRSGNKMALIGEPVFSLPETIASYSDLGPSQDQTTTMLVSSSLWGQLLKPTIKASSPPYFVFGQITYFDAFQDRTFEDPHVTDYRFQLYIDDAGTPLFRFSDRGNSSN